MANFLGCKLHFASPFGVILQVPSRALLLTYKSIIHYPSGFVSILAFQSLTSSPPKTCANYTKKDPFSGPRQKSGIFFAKKMPRHEAYHCAPRRNITLCEAKHITLLKRICALGEYHEKSEHLCSPFFYTRCFSILSSLPQDRGRGTTCGG